MCGVQWEPNAERLAILPRGQAFALVYEPASRALVRVPTGRAVRPPIESTSQLPAYTWCGCSKSVVSACNVIRCRRTCMLTAPSPYLPPYPSFQLFCGYLHPHGMSLCLTLALSSG